MTVQGEVSRNSGESNAQCIQSGDRISQQGHSGQGKRVHSGRHQSLDGGDGSEDGKSALDSMEHPASYQGDEEC